MMKFVKKKVLKRLQERNVVDIGLLRPAILPKAILEFMKVMGIGLKRPANITQVTVEFMYVGQVLPSNLPLVITEDTLKDGGSSSH